VSKTNCVNCGAAKDIDAIKCPFCGTTYLDLTAIDFSSNAPVVCDFVLPGSRDVLQMVAMPRLETAKLWQDCTELCFGNRFIASEWNAEFGVTFTPIPRNGVLFVTKKGAAAGA
jgi:hypothetical protein